MICEAGENEQEDEAGGQQGFDLHDGVERKYKRRRDSRCQKASESERKLFEECFDTGSNYRETFLGCDRNIKKNQRMESCLLVLCGMYYDGWLAD